MTPTLCQVTFPFGPLTLGFAKLRTRCVDACAGSQPRSSGAGGSFSHKNAFGSPAPAPAVSQTVNGSSLIIGLHASFLHGVVGLSDLLAAAVPGINGSLISRLHCGV